MVNIIKERAIRILKSDPAYKHDEMKYVLTVMRTLPQEELITDLHTLTYPELKAIVSCGIPGFAQNVALRLLKEKRDALDMFISEGGVEAIVGTEVEEQKEEMEDVDERVRTSESGREGDSETLDDAGSDSGN